MAATLEEPAAREIETERRDVRVERIHGEDSYGPTGGD
jgi:hypothetical protein